MFKKIKENEKVQKFQELWHNQKTHDIMVLSLWLIFIVIVILYARSNVSHHSYKPEPKEINTSNVENYEFTYKTNDKEIPGEYYNGSVLFYQNNKRYYYKNNLYQIDESASLIPNYDLDILKINIKMIDNLISNINATETNNVKEYLIPLDRFINLYEIDTDIDLSKMALYNVPLRIYYNNNEINKITIDLSNYYSVKTNTNVEYPLTIYLYNVNNVSDFIKSYDKMLEVIKWQYNY